VLYRSRIVAYGMALENLESLADRDGDGSTQR
jgi:hypothetical protein